MCLCLPQLTRPPVPGGSAQALNVQGHSRKLFLREPKARTTRSGACRKPREQAPLQEINDEGPTGLMSNNIERGCYVPPIPSLVVA
jgi:hypothetical protein